MNVLLIASVKDVFGRELKSELSNENVNVSLLDFETLLLYDGDGNKINYYLNLFKKFNRIPKISMVFRMMFICNIINKYKFDVVNIHVSRWFYIAILPWLIKQKLVITFYGSDFYRTTQRIKKIQRCLYRKADAITFTNPLTQNSFHNFYNDFEDKTYICRFGLKTLNFIDKNRDVDKKELKKILGFNTEKIIVTCGYNSTKEQQHEKIIHNILKLPEKILSKVQFVFPLTYGDVDNKEKVKNILRETNLDYKLLECFLFGDENANVKLVSDIMINMLESDSFSGSMQEYLYANNMVITGSWLPYDVFDSAGIKYIKIDKIEDLSQKLEEAIEFDLSIFDSSKNKTIIYDLSSWENNIANWIMMYEA